MSNLTYLEKVQTYLRTNNKVQQLEKEQSFQEAVTALQQKYSKVYGEGYFSKNGLKLQMVVKPAPYRFAYEDKDHVHTTSMCFALNLFDEVLRTITLVVFEITLYPYCCGMKQMNGFSYSEFLGADTEKIVHAFINDCIQAYWGVMQFSTRRLLVNFVEFRKNDGFSQYKDVPEIAKPNMSYPYFRTWAMKQKKYRANLMFNANSGNIIHHAEVVF